MIANIKQAGKDTCFWCNEEKDGLHLEVEKRPMFLCKSDFWSFVKKRSPKEKSDVDRESGSRATQPK